MNLPQASAMSLLSKSNSMGGDDTERPLVSPSKSGATISGQQQQQQQQQQQLRVASPESRNSLKQDIHLKRASLRPQELAFLTSLMNENNVTEQDINQARFKLADHTLFFEKKEDSPQTRATTPTNGERQQQPTTIETVCSEGSTRRQELLDERRIRSLHGQIWKAHQNGLALSAKSSRKSFLQREHNLTALRYPQFCASTSSFRLDGNSDDELSASNSSLPSRRRRASMVAAVPSLRHPESGSLWSANQIEQPPFLPPLGRSESGPVLRRMGSSTLANQRRQSQPPLPTFRRVNSASGYLQRSTGPFVLRRNSISGVPPPAPGSALRRRSSSGGVPMTNMVGDLSSSSSSFSGPPLRRLSSEGTAITTATGGPTMLQRKSSAEIPRAPPLQFRSSGGLLPTGTALRRFSSPAVPPNGTQKSGGAMPHQQVQQQQPTRYSRHATLRQQSSHSLQDIPEERKKCRKEQEATPTEMWEGTILPEEVEDKKMSDEEMAQQSIEPEWQYRVKLRRASENNYGGEGMEIAAAFLYDDEVDFTETGEDDDDDDDDVVVETTQEDCHEQHTETQTEATTGSSGNINHAAIMRRASVNVYGGEGMEISDWDAQEDLEERRETIDTYRHQSLQFDEAFLEQVVPTLRMSVSFDETKSLDREREEIVPARNIPRSFSEDELSSLLTVQRKLRKRDINPSDETATTLPEAESYDTFDFDAWVDLAGSSFLDNLSFRILGTSAEDIDSHPHVLSPPLMESLQAFLPFSKTSDNFWMKYSLVRDGASMHTLLQHARGAQFTILAIETVDGEVMGCFTTEPWRKTWSYFGGGDSFLWKLRQSRKTKCQSIIDQAHLESEVDIYPYTGENNCIQICRSNMIAVGGGSPEQTTNSFDESNTTEQFREHEWGHGLALQEDLLHASSAPCVTFHSPSLSEIHSDGSLFEIMNLELWSLTPCYNVDDAETLELGRLFLQDHAFNAVSGDDSLNESLNDLPSYY